MLWNITNYRNRNIYKYQIESIIVWTRCAGAVCMGSRTRLRPSQSVYHVTPLTVRTVQTGNRVGKVANTTETTKQKHSLYTTISVIFMYLTPPTITYVPHTPPILYTSHLSFPPSHPPTSHTRTSHPSRHHTRTSHNHWITLILTYTDDSYINHWLF